MRLRLIVAAFVLAGMALSAPGAELYGKPLRGLTPVSIADLHRKSATYEGKTVRVRGEVLNEEGSFRITEGAASLLVTMPEGAALPADATGAAATAEGTFRSKGPDGTPSLEATGLELTR